MFTRDFTLVVLGTFLFWGAFGTSLPVLPRFITQELGAGAGTVGLVFGTYAAAAVAARPLVGWLGDRRSRRLLIVGGSIVTAVGLLAHLAVASVPLLLAVRVIAGAGSAAVVVGFATIALDLTATTRHGEASSFVMVAVQLGMGTGPLLGALMLDVGGYTLVWVVGAVGSLVCLAIASVLPREPARAHVAVRALVHPAALRPGVVMGLGILGFVGYLAFVPLYAPQVGVTEVAPLFLLASGTIAVVRAMGARVPDRIGAVRGAPIALALLAVAFAAMGAVGTPLGLYVTTAMMAVGAALLAPSLVLASVQGVPTHERARVMATITMFLDIASAIGPASLGVVAAGRGFGVTFAIASGTAVLGGILLHLWVAPKLLGREAVVGPGEVIAEVADALGADEGDAPAVAADDAPAVAADVAPGQPDARPATP
jgi:MFS family permease